MSGQGLGGASRGVGEVDQQEVGVSSAQRRRVMLADDGPVVVEGPVEVVLPDGRTLTSDRPMVAVCTCRRSKLYPLCDTSHRRRRRRNR